MQKSLCAIDSCYRIKCLNPINFQDRVSSHNENLIWNIVNDSNNHMGNKVNSARTYRSDEYMSNLYFDTKAEAFNRVCNDIID